MAPGMLQTAGKVGCGLLLDKSVSQGDSSEWLKEPSPKKIVMAGMLMLSLPSITQFLMYVLVSSGRVR